MSGNSRSHGGQKAAVPFWAITMCKRAFTVSFSLVCMLSACRVASYCEEPASNRVCFSGNSCVAVELAATPAAREKGLMMRDSLAGDSGMLFVFERDAIHSFWMKNTLMPLDMIWIDSGCKIVDILQGAKPCVDNDACPIYTPVEPSSYTLEVNAGFVQNSSIRVGDPVSITGKCVAETSRRGN